MERNPLSSPCNYRYTSVSTITPKEEMLMLPHKLSLGRSCPALVHLEITFIQNREELDYPAATFPGMSVQFLQMSYVLVQPTCCSCSQRNDHPPDPWHIGLRSPSRSQHTTLHSICPTLDRVSRDGRDRTTTSLVPWGLGFSLTH